MYGTKSVHVLLFRASEQLRTFSGRPPAPLEVVMPQWDAEPLNFDAPKSPYKSWPILGRVCTDFCNPMWDMLIKYFISYGLYLSGPPRGGGSPPKKGSLR